MDDIDSFSSDEDKEEIEADAEVAKQEDMTSADPDVLTGPTSAQKRSHETSSSDSDKNPTPSDTNRLQVILAQQPQDGWVIV